MIFFAHALLSFRIAAMYIQFAGACVTEAQFRGRTFHEPNVLNSNFDRPKLTKVRLLIQPPNLIQLEPKLLVKKTQKTETACKIRYNNLCIRFGT